MPGYIYIRVRLWPPKNPTFRAPLTHSQLFASGRCLMSRHTLGAIKQIFIVPELTLQHARPADKRTDRETDDRQWVWEGDFNEVAQNIWLAKNHFKVAKWNSLACHNTTAVCLCKPTHWIRVGGVLMCARVGLVYRWPDLVIGRIAPCHCGMETTQPLTFDTCQALACQPDGCGIRYSEFRNPDSGLRTQDSGCWILALGLSSSRKHFD